MSLSINQQGILLMGHFSFCMQSFQRESIFAQSTAPPPPHPQEPEQDINQNGEHVLMSTCALCIHVCDTLPHNSHRSVARRPSVPPLRREEGLD